MKKMVIVEVIEDADFNIIGPTFEKNGERFCAFETKHGTLLRVKHLFDDSDDDAWLGKESGGEGFRLAFPPSERSERWTI